MEKNEVEIDAKIKKRMVWLIAVALLVFVVIIAFVFFNHEKSEDNFKCFEDYSSVEEYMKDLKIYMDDFESKHPDASDQDFFKARNQELIKHGCEGNLDNLIKESNTSEI